MYIYNAATIYHRLQLQMCQPVDQVSSPLCSGVWSQLICSLQRKRLTGPQPLLWKQIIQNKDYTQLINTGIILLKCIMRINLFPVS